MTEQQKLEYVLSMVNKTGAPLDAATKDLAKYLKMLRDTYNVQQQVLSGKGGAPRSASGQFLPYRNASPDGKVQLQAAKTLIKEREQAEVQADRSRTVRINNHARMARGIYKQEQADIANAAKEKARIERETNARLNRERRERVAAEREAEKLINDARRESNKRAVEQLRELRAEERRVNASRAARAQGVSNVLSGGGQVVSGVSGLAGNLMSFGRQILTITGYAFNFGKAIVGSVINVLQDVEHKAKIATAALTAIGAAMGVAGLKFNEFKEDTITTLTTLTNSAKTARDIFKYAFELAIPASFPFREILETGRTLESFGLKFNAYNREAGEYIKSSVMLAQGMQKPLAQVARFMGNLSQQRLLLQQAAPLAMGRATLANYGIEFDSHGSAKNRDKLAGAAMMAIKDTWGGILEEMKENYSTMWDSMVSYSEYFFGEITQGMFKSFARAMGNVADLFRELISPTTDWAKSLKEGFKTIFDLIGSLVEMASENLPRIAAWMSNIITKENIINGLVEVVSLFKVIFDDVKAFVEEASGNKGLVGIWEAFRDIATNAIDSVLEVWTEFKTIIEFIGTHGEDIWKAITDGAKGFVAILETIAGLMILNFGGQMLGNIVQTFTGVGKLFSGFKGIGGGAGAAAGTVAAGGMALGGNLLTDTLKGIWDYLKWINNPPVDPEKRREFLGQEKASENIGFVRQIGRAAVGTILNEAGGAVPQSVKDLGGKFNAMRERNMGNFATDKARRRQAASSAREWAEGAVGGVMGEKADKPSLGKPGITAEQEAWRIQFALNSAEVNESKIKAFEKGIDGYDSNDKAIVRQNGMGLYQKRVRDSYDKVISTGKDVSNRYAEAKEGQAPQIKTEDERIEDLKEYWKAVENFWDSQADIQKINREAQDAITNKFKEANDARTNMIESQIAMLPASEQATAKAENLIPMLIEKQQILIAKMKNVQQGTKEYYDLVGESWNAEKQINDLRNDAIDDQANKAFHRPTRQISTIKKLIGMMPKKARKGAMAAMVGPRIQQAYQAAMMERDPEKREDKLLEVMDLFTAFKEDSKKNDPFGNMFGKAKAAQRSQAIRNYQRGAFGGRAKRGRSRNQDDIFAAMSPFAPAPGGAGGGGFSGDKFNQLIFQLPVNATEQQMSDFVSRIINQQLTNTFGRQ